ncbi:MAG: sigma 54-interacting transcriptional regulator [Acidobacteriaceae bacterium]|jgi:DNA-binding NtrC family response regulator
MSSTQRIHPVFVGTTQSEQFGESSHTEEFAPQGSILLGDSVAVLRLRSQIQHIAPHYRTALIRGEAGTGKQLVARAIHAFSPGASRPFVIGNTSALAASIAANSRPGQPHPTAAGSLLESAHGGTLFLDGIGELPSALQSALFRFLRACEERRAAPAQPGRASLRRPDTRILAASDRDLRTLAAIGQFHQELYAHLSAVEIVVPPLRQRIEDLPILAAWLLRRLAGRTGQNPKMLAESTLAQLQGRPWPNNLRELDRVLTQAAALADGALIEPRHLLALVGPTHSNPDASTAIKIERLHDVIQQHVLDVLTRCGGNKLRAAELLGISRSTLYRMLGSSAPADPLPE